MKYWALILIFLIPVSAFGQQSIQGTPNGYPVAITGSSVVTQGLPVYAQVCSGATCYTSPVNQGAVVIASGSTSNIFSSTAAIDPGAFCSNIHPTTTATLALTDGNNAQIAAASFSMPPAAILPLTFLAGTILDAGLRASASASNVIRCWFHGHQ